MTNEQINRVIAESLGWYQKAYTEGLRWIDPQCTQQLIDPPNFLTDPAMRDLLQEKLLEDGFTITMAWLPDRQIGKLKRTNCVSMHLGKGIGSGEREFHIYDTRERIWALTYIRAHNLTADRLEGDERLRIF